MRLCSFGDAEPSSGQQMMTAVLAPVLLPYLRRPRLPRSTVNGFVALKGFIPSLKLDCLPSFVVSLLLSYDALPCPRDTPLSYAYARSTGHQTRLMQGSLTERWVALYHHAPPLPPLPTGRPLLLCSRLERTSIIQVVTPEPCSRGCQDPMSCRVPSSCITI